MPAPGAIAQILSVHTTQTFNVLIYAIIDRIIDVKFQIYSLFVIFFLNVLKITSLFAIAMK
jgi:hypothetical protein